MDIVVIDNFYAAPNAVRNLALQAEYKNVTQLNYPGFQSVKSFASKSVQDKFESELGCKLKTDPSRLTFGRFRIMLKETGSTLKVHLDGLADWTGVLYLNLPEQCEGGTAFYKHRKTGFTGPATQAEVEQLGFKSWSELEQEIIERDTLNPDAWEQTAYVGMKFNRLVLFRGNQLFHCHTHSFGHTKADGRMTQNFFFNEVKEDAT